MTQLSLHDACTADALKQQGQDAIAHTDTAFVTRLRQVAKEISKRDGMVSTDELRLWSVGHGLYPKHQNSWGSVLRGQGWTIVGYKKSAIPSTHARRIAIWRWEL